MYKNHKTRKVILGALISGIITTTFGSFSFGMAGGNEDSSLAGVQALGDSDDRMVDEEELAVESAIEDFEYEYNETGITITKYKGNKADVVIPSEIDGKPVTEIGEYAFYGCKSLEEIKIPARVTSIGGCAFDGCKLLKHSTFYGCKSLREVKFEEGSQQLREIGRWAFGGCGKLESITIPASVTSIGEGAFDGCTLLREGQIPKG